MSKWERRERKRNQRKKMPMSGKSVKLLQELIEQKAKQKARAKQRRSNGREN